MQTDEIKLMRFARQHLITPAEPVQVVQDLCGLQAQFFSNAVHALALRAHPFDRLTEAFVKTWSIRGTMHLIAKEDLPLMLHEGRAHALRPCDRLDADEAVSAERKSFFAQLILSAIAQGTDERERLKAICYENGMRAEEEASLFNPWGGLIRALCENGRICHKPQEKKAYDICDPFSPLMKSEAERLLAERYFTHYGPATVRDAAYFFGVSQKRVSAWMDALPMLSAQCMGNTYYWCEKQDALSAEPPACLFLAGFDPLMLGYEKRESLYFPLEHMRDIFSMSGMVAAVVLLRGKAAGRWKMKKNQLCFMPFEKHSTADLHLIEEAAVRQWPKFSQMVIQED